MNINGAFPSNYIKAADLQGKHIAVTIAEVKMEDIGGDHKPVLYFKNKDKGLVLNKTNANMIAEITGAEETDEWKGKRVVLYPSKTDFQGKRVDCIRVDYPQNGATAKPAPPPVVVNETADDEIPF